MRRQWTRCLPGNKSIHRLCKALENQTAGNRVPLKIQGWIFRKTVPLKPVRITPQETERLFQIMRKMKENGCAVIFISHKMNEVKSLSDRVAVLRGGRYIGSLVTKDTDVNTMTDMMVGHAVQLNIESRKSKIFPDWHCSL